MSLPVVGERQVLVTALVDVLGTATEREAGLERGEVVVAAYDKDKNLRPTGLRRQSIEIRTPAQAEAGAFGQVASVLSLAPGHYQLRVAATIGEKSGSAFTDFDVPDLSRDRLATSGLMMVAGGPGSAVARTRSAADLPVRPLLRRAFGHQEAVTAYMRIYQGTRKALQDVVVTITLRDVRDVVIMTRAQHLSADAFSRGRAADLEETVPLAQLLPGEYLMAVDAATAAESVRHAVRFSVAPPSP